jgi:hypothetical protein
MQLPEETSRTSRKCPNFMGIGALAVLGLTLMACGNQQGQQGQPEATATAQPQTEAPASTPPEAVAATGQPESGHVHEAMTDDQMHSHEAGAAHQDHDSKHGGTFFMALDEKHHLEGALMDPGIFRVFLYDDHTMPLAKQDIAEADAKVTWGSQDNAPETSMKLSADGLTLEAAPPGKLALPVELTLRIRFPGAPPGSRPELFTFPFKAFTHDPTTHMH